VGETLNQSVSQAQNGASVKLPAPGALAGDVTAALVAALLTITYALSYGALIFSGPVESLRPYGFVLVLTATAILPIVVSLTSSLPFVLAGTDGNIAAVLAVVVAAIASDLGATAAPDVALATILVALGLSAILTGLFLVALGAARAGQAVRFIPYPVTAGFLGATGWFVATGGLSVGSSIHFNVASLATLASAAPWPRLIDSIAVAAVLFVVMPRFKHFMTLPLLILAGIAVHHLAFAIAGQTTQELHAHGWLMTVPDLPLAMPWSAERLSHVDWFVLADHWGDLVAVMLVTAVTILVNVSGLEVAMARDADLDRDLRAHGLAAIVSGLTGGLIGYTSVSRSIALVKAGAQSRFAGVATGIIVIVASLEGSLIIESVPTPILGGLLLYLGLDMMRSWLVRSYRQLSLVDWLTVLGIWLIAIKFGFVTAVFAGLLAGCASFAASYSRIPVVRLRYDGQSAESNVERAEIDRNLLHDNGWQLLTMHLQGYLFFGTASSLLRQIRAARDEAERPFRYLVLDFRGVDDIDSSAVFSFERLRQLAERVGFTILFTSFSDRLARRLRGAGLVATSDDERARGVRLFDTLDHGLEWCEERILASLRPEQSNPEPLAKLLANEFADPASAEKFVALLERRRIAKGSVVIAQGEKSDDLYFLESGRVTVLVTFPSGAVMRVRTMGPGTMVGELGFYLGLIRSATVMADEAAIVYRLTRDMLAEMSREQPALAGHFHEFMARRLSARLADKDRLLAAAIER
jgi:SulP family sulfate permease